MTAVEKLGVAFRQWQRDWENFDKTGKNKPLSYNDFIKPFLEMEKQQIIDAYNKNPNYFDSAEQYYNETFKKK